MEYFSARDRHVLLSPAQMAIADQAAIAGGVPGRRLMAAAGAAVANAIMERWSLRPVLVLCGPGNNGGDGFIVACELVRAGWPVRVAMWGDAAALKGDARWAFDRWEGGVQAASPDSLAGAELVVDALLGAGLSRPLPEALMRMVRAINESGSPVCAVDVPTGVDGGTGRVLGEAVQATLTVTFFRRKPGHLLLPGRSLCGELVCTDIGIAASVLRDIGARTYVNDPDLWRADFPWPSSSAHKYRRGHALVVGGGTLLGASRLACLAAARAGAGLVTLLVPGEAWAIQAGALTSIMVEALPETGDPSAGLADARRNALLIGPGLGRSRQSRGQVLAMLDAGRPCVLDADALSVFADSPDDLFAALHAGCILTPHEGEFSRLFSAQGDKLQRTVAAAKQCGAVVLLKGADTVIASPEGCVVINDNAPPWLATAGSGDVLAGVIVGLLAGGMAPFDAACAGVWLHGLAGDLVGPGLIAEDLPDALMQALRVLWEGTEE